MSEVTVPLFVVIGIVAVIALFLVSKKVIKIILGLIAVVALASSLGILVIGKDTATINVNKLSEYISQVGDAAPEVRMKGSEPEINLNGKWVPFSEVAVVGPVTSKKITLKYDGQEFPIMDSGVTNAFRVWDSITQK